MEGLFALICLGAMVAVLALPIETKGRSLQVLMPLWMPCEFVQLLNIAWQGRRQAVFLLLCDANTVATARACSAPNHQN